MKAETVTDALLREFLLGNVNDEQRERIECLFLTDSQARERILAAEQDLIDDYLEQSLKTEDRERFLSQYDQTAEQRRKLRIARSIKDWALLESVSTRPISTQISGWSRLGTRLRTPRFVIPIAATVLITIVVVAVWLNIRTGQRNSQHLGIEQELAQLNAPASLRQVPPRMLSVDLLPVTIRSGPQQTEEVKINSEIRIVQFHLSLGQKQRYSTYQADVRRLDAAESFVITNLPEQDDGTYVRVRLPTYILRRGQYQIDLNGIPAKGPSSPIAEYTFTVVE